MSTVTFDTDELIQKLADRGIDRGQAHAIVRAIADAQDGLVTKDYLDLKFSQELAPIKTDLAVLKWMMAFLLAGMVSILFKVFSN